MARPSVLFVALLCLWLPFQAVAGSLLPCHVLNGSLDLQGLQPNEAVAHQECGGADLAGGEASSTAPQAETCFHCQMSCHFTSLILLPDGYAVPPHSIMPYSSFPAPYLDSLLLDSPHRPPIYA